MTAEQLKSSILQLAMQGRLVEQRVEEGTGDALFHKIQEEKKVLLTEGKIRKGKKQLQISEDEIPFDIPETWCWGRLSDLCDLYTGNSISESVKKSKYMKEIDGYPYIATKDVRFDYTIDYKNGVMIPFEDDFCHAPKGSVLMCIEGGSAGRKIGILDREVCFGNKLCMFNGFIDINKFIYFYLQSPSFTEIFKKGITGIIGGVSINKLKTLLVPLPPLDEQKRIVAKIEELVPFVDQYAKASTKLNTLNVSFPNQLKKSILQQAVQGKLVPQKPSDEPASVLLEKIAEEKQKLIEEGKIKKQKALPSITEDEIPFDIPDSWKWVRLNDCLDVRDGTHDTPKYHTEGYPLVTSKNLRDGVIDFSTCKMISREDFESINQRSKVDDGDILFAMIGTLGNPVLYRGEANFSIKNMALFKHIGDYLDMEYVYWFFMFAQYDIKKQASGGVQSFVSLSFLRNYLIPLPPVEEQHRIVKKLLAMSNVVSDLGKEFAS